MNTSNFEALGISGQFSHVLAEANYETPTKIQSRAIPPLLDGRDVLGVAQTGTGKTAAFGLPLLQLLDNDPRKAKPKHPRGLVLAPTRELATQIFTELSFFAQPTSLRLACIFGGVSQVPQVRKLAQGVDIVVATPGRLLDLTNQGLLKLSDVSHLVLDEADRLLDMGFVRDVKRIVAQTPKKRHSLLFSATMPREVVSLANEILDRPQRVDVAPSEVTVAKTKQHVAIVPNEHKLGALIRLLFTPEVKRAIVFGRTKHGTEKIAKKLRSSGIDAESIHGNKSQNQRVRALEAFKSGHAWVLVATDIAARGIDIEGVTHVVNYELPHEPESYVHRIGRTGRAGADGCAWSFVDPSERKRLTAVERLIGFSPTMVKLDLGSDEAVQVAESVREPRHPRQQQSGQGSNQQRRRRPRRRKVKAAA